MRVVSTIYQSNPNELIALKDTGIKSFADLKGKTVGVPAGSSQTTMLPLLLKANGLTEQDMQLVNMPMPSMVPSLLTGQVEAILGSLDSYAIQVRAQGAEIDEFPFADYGVPTVSTSIFAANDFIEKNPEVLRNFVKASLKGWSFALDNPDKAVADVKALFRTPTPISWPRNSPPSLRSSVARRPSSSAGPNPRTGSTPRTCSRRSVSCPRGRIPQATTPTTTCPPRARCAPAPERRESCGPGRPGRRRTPTPPSGTYR